MLMKSRLQGATKGHGLLKKKADALQMRFRMILGKIIEVSSSSLHCGAYLLLHGESFIFIKPFFKNMYSKCKLHI